MNNDIKKQLAALALELESTPSETQVKDIFVQLEMLAEVELDTARRSREFSEDTRRSASWREGKATAADNSADAVVLLVESLTYLKLKRVQQAATPIRQYLHSGKKAPKEGLDASGDGQAVAGGYVTEYEYAVRYVYEQFMKEYDVDAKAKAWEEWSHSMNQRIGAAAPSKKHTLEETLRFEWHAWGKTAKANARKASHQRDLLKSLERERLNAAGPGN